MLTELTRPRVSLARKENVFLSATGILKQSEVVPWRMTENDDINIESFSWIEVLFPVGLVGLVKKKNT